MRKVLKLSTPWCSPCRQLKPVFDSVKEHLTSNELIFEEIDIEENYEISERYNIRGVPTILITDEDGNEVKRNVGFINETKLIEFITK